MAAKQLKHNSVCILPHAEFENMRSKHKRLIWQLVKAARTAP